MTKLIWGQLGSRRFETGIDRGVIYPMDGTDPVVWDGLVSVSENRSREVKSFYTDSIKYLDHQVIGAYAAKVQAITYPEKLDDLTGVARYAQGVYLHDQVARPCHLSYRTLIGSDSNGTDHGYKLHLVYNVLVAPSDVTYNTLSTNSDPATFEFDLTATPPPVWGIRPTAHLSMHVSLDALGVSIDVLHQIEVMLYGDDDFDPAFPDLEDLLRLVNGT